MSEREFVSKSSARSEEDEVVASSGSQSNVTDVTDLLDEIDLVLEKNAEEFVKSFVQKGGE